MLNKLYLLIIVLTLSTFHNGFAQEVKKVSLEDAQQMALQFSEDVDLASIEIEKAQQQVRQSLGELLPQAYGQLTYTQYGKLPGTIGPFGPNGEDVVLQFGKKFNVNADLTMTQVLFNGVFLVGLKAANTFIEIVERQKGLAEDEAKQLVKDSYIQALLAQENIEIISINEENLLDLLEGTTAMYENGFVEKLDVDRLQLALNNLRSRIVEAERQQSLAEIVLKYQMGMNVYEDIMLTDSLDKFISEIDYNIAQKGDFTKRKELALFDARKKVNEYNVKRYKSLNYPSVTLFGTAGSAGQRDKFNFFKTDQPWLNTYFLGFEMVVPIWDSFKGKAQTEYARLDIQRIDAERSKFERSLDLQFENAKTNLLNAKVELDDAERNVALAQSIYDISKIKYEEGVGTSLELSDAERALFNSQTNVLQAKHKLLTAKTDLDKALGNY